MISERDLLLQSVPPDDAGWAAYEATFLGKSSECLLDADLIALAQGQVVPAPAAGLQLHLDRCAYCKSQLDTYKDGRGQGVPNATPVAAALPQKLSRPRPAPRPTEGMSSVVLTGIFTLLLQGRTQEALSYLRPYLPEVLEALGLKPGLADRLWQYILDRAQQQPGHSPALFPGWLQDFTREALPDTGCSSLPASFDLQPVVARCALRAVQASPEEPPEVRQFLQAALERGVRSDAELELFNLSGRAEGPWISDPACRRVIQKVRGEQRRVAPLFGIN